MKGVNRKVELECVSKDLQQLRENVLRLQVRWEEVNPNRHVVGILSRANHLGGIVIYYYRLKEVFNYRKTLNHVATG
ncbi:MAG: hypothetical protein Q4A10_06190 [Aerococcaceae bacterium]|nr:hypothetical protein [Aerococcaceae bacterium]